MTVGSRLCLAYPMFAGPPRIVLSRPKLDAPGVAALGARWRLLEAVANPSPFQTWTWIGCAAERFADPLLIEAHDAEGRLGIALWNRRRSWLAGDSLWLHESGDPALDAVFTEHNDPLLARRAPEGLLAAMLRAALWPRDGRAPRLVLSGVGAAARDAALQAGAIALPGPDRAAPYVDFARVPSGVAYIEQLSRNTRQQLRRSDRAYAAQGPLRIERAADAGQAQSFLNALIVLHAATWAARGKPGAFATEPVRRFHRRLIGRGAPDEVELLRITAGGLVVGYLYNLVHGGWACAYQSGFDYPGAGPHEKPGLTCHHLAIEMHRARGGTSYDFLGGADRYKRSLSNTERVLHWLSVAPPRHPAAKLAQVRRLIGR